MFDLPAEREEEDELMELRNILAAFIVQSSAQPGVWDCAKIPLRLTDPAPCLSQALKVKYCKPRRFTIPSTA